MGEDAAALHYKGGGPGEQGGPGGIGGGADEDGALGELAGRTGLEGDEGGAFGDAGAHGRAVEDVEDVGGRAHERLVAEEDGRQVEAQPAVAVGPAAGDDAAQASGVGEVAEVPALEVEDAAVEAEAAVKLDEDGAEELVAAHHVVAAEDAEGQVAAQEVQLGAQGREAGRQVFQHGVA